MTTPDIMDPAAIDRALGYLLKRVYQDAVNAMEPLFMGSDLTLTQWAALVSIYLGVGATCATLAKDLGHDMGATSRVIDVLEKRGLVMRRRDQVDRRVVRVTLTPLGVERAAAHRERLIARWREVLGDWPEEEVELLVAGLQKLRRTLETKAREEPT